MSEIREGNSYYENIHNSVGKFDFVMANSASDARGSEQDIRKSLIEKSAVDVMVSVGSNFFYTVVLSCTLWFLDRAHRDFLPERHPAIKFIIVKHYS